MQLRALWFRAGRSWRFWIAVWALEIALLGAAAGYGLAQGLAALEAIGRSRGAGFGGQEDALDAVTACCRFSLARFEATALSRWVAGRMLAPPAQGAGPDGAGVVNHYFGLVRMAAQGALAVNGATDAAERMRLEQQLRQVKQQQLQLRSRAEHVMAAMVGRALGEEGFTTSLPGPDRVFPPLAFTLVRPPQVLVISPRSVIRLERVTLLIADLDDATIERMENEATALGWSAEVEPTGGFSSYPTIVDDSAPRDYTLQTIAHEWTHTYLFFHPLGFNYFTSPELRTVNETVADIVGREVGGRVIEAYFPAPSPAPAPPQSPSPPPPDERPAPFDFRQEMRTTRLEAERLLSEGMIDEAEQYMEQRRLFFVEHGYNIRRLNQAYFAFHGSYADSPGSVSPIGPQLDALLQRTASLRQFVTLIQRVGSAQQYRELLREYGIENQAE